LKTLAGFCLILVIILVSLSAYLRLAHSGIGCSDWPACYGRIGQPTAISDITPTVEFAYQKLVEQNAEPLAWATPLHRLVASVLGLLVIALNVLTFRQKRHRTISLALLALTVFLAVLGIRSGSLHDPAVVMGNLVGGFTMLGLLGWLYFRLAGRTQMQPESSLGPSTLLIILAIILLASQILLGGLTSANFAATACRTLPDCHGAWLPGAELAKAMDLGRHHQVTASGQAIGGPERIAIHITHRLGAVLASVIILLTGLLAIRVPGHSRRSGIVITGLILLELTVGITSVLSGLPILLAVAHNWLAALLLLSLLSLLAAKRNR